MLINHQKRDSLYFHKNRNSLIEGHNIHEHVAIKRKKVLGYYPSECDALTDMAKKGYKLGDFVVHQCIPEEQEIAAKTTRSIF